MTQAFARGLSDAFLSWLQMDAGRALLDVLAGNGLDVRLRPDYLNVYEAQCSVAKLEWKPRRRSGELSIHRAHVRGTPLEPTAGTREYCAFQVNEAFVAEYAAALPAIRARASQHHGDEGTLEGRCVNDNLTGTPLLALDRQIALPGERGRLDVLAVSADPKRPLLVAVELKQGLNNDIQRVASQTLQYTKLLDPDGAGLRTDIANAYRRVCSQLRALGRAAPEPELIESGMRVAGLVALGSYNSRSDLLARARSEASTLDRVIGFCELSVGSAVLPDPETWITAPGSGPGGKGGTGADPGCP